jgi:hypothetical protein
MPPKTENRQSRRVLQNMYERGSNMIRQKASKAANAFATKNPISRFFSNRGVTKSTLTSPTRPSPEMVAKTAISMAKQNTAGATSIRNISPTLKDLRTKVTKSPLAKGLGGATRFIGDRVNRYSTAGRAARGVLNRMAKMKTGKLGMAGLVAVGFTAITSMGVAKGLMNGARERVVDRYMQDQRYSRNMLHNSRVGLASGTNRMNRWVCRTH